MMGEAPWPLRERSEMCTGADSALHISMLYIITFVTRFVLHKRGGADPEFRCEADRRCVERSWEQTLLLVQYTCWLRMLQFLTDIWNAELLIRRARYCSWFYLQFCR